MLPLALITLFILEKCSLLYIVDVEFVDAVITEVHARVPHVLIATVVFDSSKSDQSLFVKVNQERIVTRHSDVQTQITFMSVDQKRIVDVLGSNNRFVSENLFWL